jgi:quercetin dioxygenase-like cupin family protein
MRLRNSMIVSAGLVALVSSPTSMAQEHRFPVTAYVLEGTFTLEMEGRAPVTVKAGQAIVEPPRVKMTGYNRSSTEPMRVVIFYVSDPDTPFLDPAHH